MALNHVERRLLLEAQRRICNGQSRYICLALSRETDWSNCAEAVAARRLKAYIHKELKHCMVLESWMDRYAPDIKKRDAFSMRQYRVKWIDWMLGKI